MNEKPTHLDLFSGIGGFALAARLAGFRTIGFCEIDKYCQQVLGLHFPNIRSIPNIRNLDGGEFANVTLITGGFPCQPFSCAGKRRGKEYDRHLWPEMLRVIKEARPAWVLGENVAGIIGMELDAVLSDLEAIGYACRPFVIPACGVDARHRRNRVWIVANRDEWRCEERSQQNSDSFNGFEASRRNDAGRCGEAMVEPNGARCEHAQEMYEGSGEFGEGKSDYRTAGGASRWEPEPGVGRVAHGIPARVDRLRGLGNAIVPQVAFQIMRAIREQIAVAGTNPAPEME